MHRLTSNNKPEGWIEHQPEQPQIGVAMLSTGNVIGLSGFSVNEKRPGGSHTGRRRRNLNIDELFFHVLLHRLQAQFQLSVFRTIFTPACGYIYISVCAEWE